MTAEERKRINWLCLRIQEEKDPKIFDQLVRELNELLEIKHERIHRDHDPATKCQDTDSKGQLSQRGDQQ